MLRLTFSFIVTISSNIQKYAPLPSEGPDDATYCWKCVYVFQRGM